MSHHNAQSRDMLGRPEAIGVGEALHLIMQTLPETSGCVEQIPLTEALGRVLAEDVTSPEDQPGFARSTMDGFAVHAPDTYGASETSPQYLIVAGNIPMGEEPYFAVTPGQCARIATGGMLPEGADAVLMFEYAQKLDDKLIEVHRALAPGENVIQRGEDVARGVLLIEAGRRLRPQDIAVLASLGMTKVLVRNRPVVAIISTGDEIVPASEPTRPGVIRDSNSHHLRALVEQHGGEHVFMGIVRDELEGLARTVIEAVSKADIILITGGSSVGVRDMTERVISDLGRVLFHSVTLKPGKPLLAGVVRDRPTFGLPGHPRAVAVCFDLFVRPALVQLEGLRERDGERMSHTVRARLTQSIHSPAGRQENVTVSLEERDGELWAVPLLGKSGVLSTMVRADGTFEIPVGLLGHEKGDSVTVTLY
jgi:molybdopterin molybdotransferase